MSVPTFEQCMVEVDAKRVTCRESDDGNYCIFNYAPMVEMKKWWNDVNVWCRGLIFDKNNTSQPVAVPFKKFWNVNQKPETRAEVLAERGWPIAVQSKLDGSLGVGFWDIYADRPRISTRGSLESPQAKWATKWLNDNVTDEELEAMKLDMCPRGIPRFTHLVEIIYSTNRIVVLYDFEGLVHLDTVVNDTGSTDIELGVSQTGFLPASWRRAERLVPTSLTELLERAKGLPGMEEGYVCTYADGLKVKIKGQEYIHLHRIRFDLTPRRIYELLVSTEPGKIVETVDALLISVPDEFADPVRRVAVELVARYNTARESVIWHAAGALLECRRERKKMALYGKANLPKELLGSFFAFLDEDVERANRLVWRAVDYTDQVI